jgi:hypothetical protein
MALLSRRPDPISFSNQVRRRQVASRLRKGEVVGALTYGAGRCLLRRHACVDRWEGRTMAAPACGGISKPRSSSSPSRPEEESGE